MPLKNVFQGSGRISKVLILILFLALIRALGEPFRLQYVASAPLLFSEVKAYIIGAIITSIGLIAMIILSWFKKHKAIWVIFILTLTTLVWIKIRYILP